MRLLRIRVTIRRLMLAVAAAAIALGGVLMARRAEVARRHVALLRRNIENSSQMVRLLEAELGETRRRAEALRLAGEGGEAAKSLEGRSARRGRTLAFFRERLDSQERMRRGWERVARTPWLSAPPE